MKVLEVLEVLEVELRTENPPVYIGADLGCVRPSLAPAVTEILLNSLLSLNTQAWCERTRLPISLTPPLPPPE